MQYIKCTIIKFKLKITEQQKVLTLLETRIEIFLSYILVSV